MDKKNILAFVLIGVILFGWLYWSSYMQSKYTPPPPPKDSLIVQDTTTPPLVKEIPKDTVNKADSLVYTDLINKFGNKFYKNTTEFASKNGRGESVVVVETDKAIIEFTNQGAAIKKYIAKEFKTWDGHQVQLIDWQQKKDLSILFTSIDGRSINTSELAFSNTNGDSWIKISEKPDFKLVYTLELNESGNEKIILTYTFKKDAYDFDLDVELVNSPLFMKGAKYQLVWGASLNMTEFRSDQEATYAEAFAYMGGELETMDASSTDEEYKADYNGVTDYVSTRNKYFGVFLIPTSKKSDGAYLTGKRFTLPDEGVREVYSIALKNDVKNEQSDKSTFSILLAPLDYQILKAYDRELELTMRFTLDFLVRPIAQYFILPFFFFLHSFIPNYGLVIIIFAVVMKILLNPLTKKQMESMKKMGQLSPKMTEIREKYKDDPMLMNQKIMEFYKEQKINPAGGCLPMLLQLPILYALFGVFQSTIELRQAPFIFWINDLSAPDVIFHLPFKIPLFGIDQVSGLATLMGITMFIQQKQTVTDPKQKAMVYIMPVMLTLLFFSFPAGLNLYYFVFNLLSIAQQYYETKIKAKNEPVIEVVTPKKENKYTSRKKLNK